MNVPARVTYERRLAFWYAASILLAAASLFPMLLGEYALGMACMALAFILGPTGMVWSMFRYSAAGRDA